MLAKGFGEGSITRSVLQSASSSAFGHDTPRPFGLFPNFSTLWKKLWKIDRN